MTSAAEMIDAFRQSGRKITPQREQIFAVLAGNPSHPSAESVFDEVVAVMPSVSLKTVYTTLHEMADLGLVRSLELGTGSGRFDPNVAEHHHLVCDDCGAVADVAVDAAPIPSELAGTGFVIDRTDIVFRGRCATCASSPT